MFRYEKKRFLIYLNLKMNTILYFLLNIAMFPAVVRGDGVFLGTGFMNQQVIDEIVDRHNEHRRYPFASNMKKMSWDPELEYYAQKYSERCRFVHSAKKERATESFGQNIGENLINTGEYSAADLYYYGIEDWYNEVSDYTYASNTCGTNKICGHYTQVIWADSYKVGCGASECSSVENAASGSANWVAVCLYHPAGNTVFYGTADSPYESGSACSSCDACDSCTDDLCSNATRDAVREWAPPTTTQSTTTTQPTTTLTQPTTTTTTTQPTTTLTLPTTTTTQPTTEGTTTTTEASTTFATTSTSTVTAKPQIATATESTQSLLTGTSTIFPTTTEMVNATASATSPSANTTNLPLTFVSSTYDSSNSGSNFSEGRGSANTLTSLIGPLALFPVTFIVCCFS